MMTQKVFILLFVAKITYSQFEKGGCSVCGEGKKVGNGEAIFAYPGQPKVSCSLLESAGENGSIPPDLCNKLPSLVTVCECGKSLTSMEKPPTSSPSQFEESRCSVCGEGKKVGNGEAIFAYPGQPKVSCSLLESAGESGSVPPELCSELPSLVTVCECVGSLTSAETPPTSTSVETLIPNAICEEGSIGISRNSNDVALTLMDAIEDITVCARDAAAVAKCVLCNSEACSSCITKLKLLQQYRCQDLTKNFFNDCGCDPCKEQEKAFVNCHCKNIHLSHEHSGGRGLSPTLLIAAIITYLSFIYI